MAGYCVECPQCANLLYDDGQLSGHLVMCPRCGQHFQMPSPNASGVREELSTLLQHVKHAVETNRSASPRTVQLVGNKPDFMERAFARYVFIIVPIASLLIAIVATTWDNSAKAEREKRWQQTRKLMEQEAVEIAAEEERLNQQLGELNARRQSLETAITRRESDQFTRSLKGDRATPSAERQQDEVDRNELAEISKEVERVQKEGKDRVKAIQERYQKKYSAAEPGQP